MHSPQERTHEAHFQLSEGHLRHHPRRPPAGGAVKTEDGLCLGRTVSVGRELPQSRVSAGGVDAAGEKREIAHLGLSRHELHGLGYALVNWKKK